MDTSKCVCTTTDELNGRTAEEYAQSHLKKLSVNGELWEILFECPITGIQWIEDFPQSEAHGGGPPRMRKLLTQHD